MKPQSHKPKCWLASLITRERFISLTDWRVVAKVCWISLGEPALSVSSLRCSLSSFTTIWQLLSSMQTTENLVVQRNLQRTKQKQEVFGEAQLVVFWVWLRLSALASAGLFPFRLMWLQIAPFQRFCTSLLK